MSNITGTAGNDTITGTTAADEIYGGDANDTITGGLGNDVIYGGKGTDTVSYSGAYGNFKLTALYEGKNGSFSGFTVAYFVLGFGLFLDRVGDLTLAAELCPTERRSALQAILGFFNVFSLLLATTLSGQVYRITQSFHAVAWLAAGCAVISMLLLARIPEPRHQKRC